MDQILWTYLCPLLSSGCKESTLSHSINVGEGLTAGFKNQNLNLVIALALSLPTLSLRNCGCFLPLYAALTSPVSRPVDDFVAPAHSQPVFSAQGQHFAVWDRYIWKFDTQCSPPL